MEVVRALRYVLPWWPSTLLSVRPLWDSRLGIRPGKRTSESPVGSHAAKTQSFPALRRNLFASEWRWGLNLRL